MAARCSSSSSSGGGGGLVILVALISLLAVIEPASAGQTFRVRYSPPDKRDPEYNAFASLPLTVRDAKAEGFVQVPENSECESGNFVGWRYYKDSDPALVLLYDDNQGYLAGVQAAFPKRLIADPARDWFSQHPFFANDVIGGDDAYTLTAYLVHPEIICTTGRTEDEFANSPSGTGVFVQFGHHPLKFVEVPKRRDEIDGGSVWKEGRCFPAMGLHYWYNTKKWMNCNDFRPFFTLYDRDALTAFGWVLFAPFQHFSDRFDVPLPRPYGSEYFMNPVPACFKTEYPRVGGFTVMHYYVDDHPWNITC